MKIQEVYQIVKCKRFGIPTAVDLIDKLDEIYTSKYDAIERCIELNEDSLKDSDIVFDCISVDLYIKE